MEPFVGQIQPLGFSFAPVGWATCDGQLMAISANDALFSLLGTIYGGDGRTTFGLPDLRGRMMVHQGTGPGLTPHALGSQGGSVNTTLTAANLPPHQHAVNLPVSSAAPNTTNSNRGYLTNQANDVYAAGASAGATYGGAFNTGQTGNSSGINNLQPFTVINICIAVYGIYPSRN